MKTSRYLIATTAIMLAAAPATLADTHDVAAGATDTLTGVTETSATVKTGDGTLELNGANSLKRLRVSAGSLHISGGSTTISDSTATGTGVGSCVMESETGAQSILIDGGAQVSFGGGSYANFRGGTFTITNATFDATGLGAHFMIAHGGVGSGGSEVVVGEGGILKANYIRPASSGTRGIQAVKETTGLRLNRGGAVHLAKQFFLDANSAYYGRIWFDGGILYASNAGGNLFGNGLTTTWGENTVSPTVCAGGCYISTDVANTIVQPAFWSGAGAGEKDGGVHFLGKGSPQWYAQGSAFNGGVWLESSSGAMLKVNPAYGDSVFGAVPETPEANIFVTGANHTLYAQYNSTTPTLAVNPNRNVSIANGKPFIVAAAENARLAIGGEIKGEAVGGLDYPTNTCVQVRGDYAGTIVIGPGENRTNDVGRLVVAGNLEVTSGVTRVTSGAHGTGSDKALLHVTGNLSVQDGAEIVTPQTDTSYVTVQSGGHADICGGTVSLPNSDWCNAHSSMGLTTIRDGGVLDVGIFRMGQMVTDGSTVVHLATNGLLRAGQLYLWVNDSNNIDVTFLFDGGAIQSANGTDNLFTSVSNVKWNGVTFAVGPGGAVLDTSNGKNIWWRKPLVTATEGVADGGLVVRRTGSSGAAILMVPCSYNGPTTIDGGALQQRGGDNLLPSGTTLVLSNGGQVGFCKYDGQGSTDQEKQANHTRTAATLGGIEGSGTLNYCGEVVVNGKIAPSIGGTITFYETCDLSNATLEIAGDATGCGKLAFNGTSGPYSGNQDISGITLSMADPSTFDKNAANNFYRITTSKYTGQFQLAADWPDDWAVKYESNGVYLRHINAFVMVLR